MVTPTDPVSNTQNSSNKDYKYGSTTGVCLTCPVTLNTNSLDIEEVGGHPSYYTVQKWTYFLNFINGDSELSIKSIKPNFNPKDTKINSDQWKKLSLEIISIFNTNTNVSAWARLGSQYPHRGNNNLLTQEDIYAIQRFNHKTDSNVQIDGWLGTQTFMLDYPRMKVLIKVNLDKNNKVIKGNIQNFLLPGIWGNIRYVIPNVKNNENPRFEDFTLYDPSIHTKDKFQQFTQQLIDFYGRSTVDRDPDYIWEAWRNLGPTVSLTPSAEQINSQTTRNQADTTNRANQTSLINNINR